MQPPVLVTGQGHLIDFLLAGHMTPPIGLNDLVAAGIFNGGRRGRGSADHRPNGHPF
jgi:hypothetical protein